MKLGFKPFDTFIKNYTTSKSRQRYTDSDIKEIEIEDNYIHAIVKGSRSYTVKIEFNDQKVRLAQCNCPYDYGGYCKHVVHVMVYADKLLADPQPPATSSVDDELAMDLLTKDGNRFILSRPSVLDLSKAYIQQISLPLPKKKSWGSAFDLPSADFEPQLFKGVVSDNYTGQQQTLNIEQREGEIHLTCTCNKQHRKLCPHLHFVLLEILANPVLQLSFDTDSRQALLMMKTDDNGWGTITEPDNYFKIYLQHGRVYVAPKFQFLPYTHQAKSAMKRALLPDFQLPSNPDIPKKAFVILTLSPYSDQPKFKLVEAPLTKAGEIKSPIDTLAVQEKLRSTSNQEELLFYAALLAMDHSDVHDKDIHDILRNPMGLDFYLLNEPWSYGKITPKKLSPLTIAEGSPKIAIKVKQKDEFYIMRCQVQTATNSTSSKNIERYGSVIIFKDSLYRLSNETEGKVLRFFKEHSHEIYLQHEQFHSFKKEFLDQLENKVSVSYSFIKPASKKLIKDRSLDVVSDPIIYLSESGDFVLLTPAIAYGDVEVPLLSKKTVYSTNPDGSLSTVERNEIAEHQFVRSIQARHPSFNNWPQTEFYYLHKREFLDEGWFINAFEAWRAEGFSIMGFNDLKNNNYNQHPIKIRTSVQSGIDWFDIHADIAFGKQKVTLKQIQKSIANKSRYIELGDGTKGILPQEWIEKFNHYFRSGEIKADVIRTHKSNFQLIDELFEREILSQEVQLEIQQYKQKLSDFHAISTVTIPKKLKATLRDYQKEGLNWLNFLDEFGFGGCLADDMGLGKTVQVIAYFLAQHEKGNTQTNLIIVPTSLLFNWQKELEKFAPHLKYHVLYGAKRKTDEVDISKYDLVLTTYGTLLSDITFLKTQTFNIIVLDESQAIKNPDSKRYKAVRLLSGRQRLVLTGTPVENNTFDLYAQLSFALPGLLGSAKRFADDYSTPIDKFRDGKRAQELQRKIHPFVLRRTKKQVAKELPEKTEMVVYCEMGIAQKRVYDTYKYEFQKYLSGMDDDELHSSSLHILQGLTKMRQICNSPALLSDNEYYGDQSAKLEEIAAQVDTLKDAHKILIFSQFVGMLDLIKLQLEQKNIGYAYLTGKTKKREEQVQLFQEDERIRVFLISLKAGGTGLNLTQAEYVFMIDPWWNPAVENQAIDRAYRIGQKNNVVAVRFITPDSIEEKIMELQQRKRQLAEDLIHTDNNMLKQLSKHDLMGLL